jgi:hypothetical protein
LHDCRQRFNIVDNPRHQVAASNLECKLSSAKKSLCTSRRIGTQLGGSLEGGD